MSTSPILPPAQNPNSAHDPHQRENNTSSKQQHATPLQSQQQQQQHQLKEQSPRRLLEHEQSDSSLSHKPTPQYTRDDNNNNYNNNNHDSTRTAHTENKRLHSPSRDNNNNSSSDQGSFSPRPHEQQQSSSPTQDQSESSYEHGYYPYTNANVPRQGSPQHPYYHEAHPARRSASPVGAPEAPTQSLYYKTSSEPCREPCCFDSTRVAALYPSNSHSSSSYVAYPSGGAQAHYYYSSEQTASRTHYSPDSPRTPAFSPSLPSSSSTSSPSSSSAAPYTPTTNSPATAHRPKQGVVFHDSSRTILTNSNNGDHGDAQYMDMDRQSSEQSKSTATTTRTGRTASKPFKIPRPANSFMLYRAENGKKYPGLVATELSAKLGEAWRREPQDVRDRYDELAEQAKRDHALKYPGYKFAPVKRGTGKRALKLAAEAIANEMAEMDAATLLISMASMLPTPTPSAAATATPILSQNHDHRIYTPTSPTHNATSVSTMGTRPKAQRPIKVASLNDSNMPNTNDEFSSGPAPNNSTESTGTSTAKDTTPEHESLSNHDMDAATGGAAPETGAGALQQTSRAYPQLSPPLILFREALARRSPQLASSLVAQIVINVWLGVTDELRERYEIMAESDPRFKDKNGYIKHVPVTSGTPTTASEAMMANQIAQLLRKAAAAEQLTLPQSNKRKRTLSKSHGSGSKLTRIAPAPVSISVPTAKPTEHSPFRHWMDPAHIPERVEPAPAPREPSPTVSTATASPVLAEIPLTSVPIKAIPAPTKTVPARNDPTPATVIPMPMPSPNRRRTRASSTVVTATEYTAPTSPSSSSPAVPAKVSKVTKKVTPSKIQKAKAKEEEKVTPANRPIRRIVRPTKYSA